MKYLPWCFLLVSFIPASLHSNNSELSEGLSASTSASKQLSRTSSTPVTNYPYFEDFGTAPSTQLPGGYSRGSTNPTNSFNWYVNAGFTPSAGTGPAADFDNNNNGNYIFTEGSSPAASGDLAYLYLPEFDLSSLPSPELLFGYHMYGAGISVLKLERYDSAQSAWVGIDSIVGQRQSSSTEPWRERSVDLSAYTSSILSLRFVNERGSSFHCDVAIDNIHVRKRPLCKDPANFSVRFKNDVKLGLSWNSDTNVTSSVIQYGPRNFVLGSGNQVTTSRQSITIGGLGPDTCYDFYVQDNCTEATQWIGPLRVCMDPVCGVSGLPFNVVGDSAGCGGGAVSLTGTPTPGMLLGWTLDGKLVGVGDTLNDQVSRTSVYKARNISTDGPTYYVGPYFSGNLTSMYQQDASGLYISVYDTVVIDSVSIRSNDGLTAQVIVTDGRSIPAGGKVIRRGEIFTTPSSTFATLKVPVGIVLTPGNYFIAVDFLAGSGGFYRATDGASYPYTPPTSGLFSIDSSSFGGPNYYYLFRMQVRHACISDQGVDALAHTFNAYAGEDDSISVCYNRNAIKLTDYLDYYSYGGFWTDDNGTGALSDSILDATQLAVGSTNQFSYYVFQGGNCPGQDTAIITVTVDDSVYAGAGGADTLSNCYQPVDLNSYLAGSVTPGGTWRDIDNSGGLFGSMLYPGLLDSGFVFRYEYYLQSACGDESAEFNFYIDCVLNEPEYVRPEFSVYPNPTTGVVMIEGLNDQPGITEIEVYSAGGRLLKQYQSNKEIKVRLDVSDFAAGLYILRVFTTTGWATFKVRKQ